MEELNTLSDPQGFARSLRELDLFDGVPEERLDEIARIVAEARREQVQSSLRGVDLFEGLSDDDLRDIEGISSRVRLDPGEVLFEEGEPGDAFYVVLRGAVELFKGRSGGTEQKLAISRPGGTFGEMALLNDTPRSASARAAEDTALLSIDREDFQRILGEGIAVRLLQGLSRALWATSVRLASQQSRQAEEPRGVLRQVSRLIQRRLLPRTPPEIEGFELAADAVVSEADDGRVLWDSFRLAGGRHALASLEVRGQGLPPGHHLALCRVLLHELGPECGDPAELLARVNDALAEIHIEDLGQHVEAVLLTVAADRVECAATGGTPLLLARSDGEVERISPVGAPLGIEKGREFTLESLHMGPGDAVFLLSGRDESELPGALTLAELQEEEDPVRILGRLRHSSRGGSMIVVRRTGTAGAGAEVEAAGAEAEPAAGAVGDGSAAAAAPTHGAGAARSLQDDAIPEGRGEADDASDDLLGSAGDFDSLPEIPRI